MKRSTLIIVIFALLLAACAPSATTIPQPAATVQPAAISPSAVPGEFDLDRLEQRSDCCHGPDCQLVYLGRLGQHQCLRGRFLW